jgi:lipopolysaccharide/colanic/teichoic acid biosynthesis glycosyltransferase
MSNGNELPSHEATVPNPESVQGDPRIKYVSSMTSNTHNDDKTMPANEYLPSNHDIARASILTRCIEVIIALAAIVVALPIFIALTVIIKRGSAGPALFKQQRLGLEAKNFTFLKFRTLYVDARERFPELYVYKYSSEELDNLHFKVTNDPRVTQQGQWLRKTSLDEVPNFWCVVTGKMALVGPRPEIPEMLPYYKGEMLKKFSVRPGITGLAQTSGRGNLSFKETVAYDLEYVNNKSIMLDIKIILKTIKQMLLHEGAF